MSQFVLPLVWNFDDLNTCYALARKFARRRLWSRGWSSQDVEDAAAEAVLAVSFLSGSSVSEADVIATMSRAVDSFRARERRVRYRQVHFADDGALERVIERVEVLGRSSSTKAEDERLRARRKNLCRAMVTDPETVRRVRVVTLLATLSQVAPRLAHDDLIDGALAASGGGRGIVRSADSFRPKFQEACSALVQAMEEHPHSKQFPAQIRRLAWVFRGADDERYEEVSQGRITTMVNWLYQARARGEARLEDVARSLPHFIGAPA